MRYRRIYGQYYVVLTVKGKRIVICTTVDLPGQAEAGNEPYLGSEQPFA